MPTPRWCVSAGAVDSPRLLLLSGIGPAAELEAVGVEVVHDLPGVGRNLHDHPLCGVVYEAAPADPRGADQPRRDVDGVAQRATR